MCQYQIIEPPSSNILICTVTGELCDFCIWGTQNHFQDGENMNNKNGYGEKKQ